MRIIYFFLAVFAVSCATTHRHVVTPHPPENPSSNQQSDHPPDVCQTVTGAINRADWATLRTFVKPGTHMNEYISSLEDAKKASHPVQVGKLLNVQTVAETNRTSIRLYSFSLQNTDGTVNPHWLQIKVREDDGQADVLDFWNFGW